MESLPDLELDIDWDEPRPAESQACLRLPPLPSDLAEIGLQLDLEEAESSPEDEPA
jgi:hypothetical protein